MQLSILWVENNPECRNDDRMLDTSDTQKTRLACYCSRLVVAHNSSLTDFLRPPKLQVNHSERESKAATWEIVIKYIALSGTASLLDYIQTLQTTVGSEFSQCCNLYNRRRVIGKYRIFSKKSGESVDSSCSKIELQSRLYFFQIKWGWMMWARGCPYFPPRKPIGKNICNPSRRDMSEWNVVWVLPHSWCWR